MKWNLSDTKNFRCKKAITVLALVSVACVVLANIGYLVLSGRNLIKILWVVFLMLSSVLLVIEVRGIHRLTAVFAAHFVRLLLEVVFGLRLWHALPENFYFAEVVLVGLAIFGCVSGRGKKMFPLVAVCIGLGAAVLEMISYIQVVGDYVFVGGLSHLFDDPFVTHLFFCSFFFISFVAFFVALLLFILKNNFRNPPEKKVDYAQALRTLKESYENGILTEEEYQSRRAEIIGKL